MLYQAGLRRRLFTHHRRMLQCDSSHEEPQERKNESREESILAFLGIAGTILNLLVIIFVYIYTSL
ncbi:protein TUNAR-like isoform X2 [Hoplias malabaricus]|uniref:protein TUNAR-like isoform X2 n=1 Tax=Hoplias malabaricus TaxID=27720 RepID=UPI003461A883